MAQVGVITLVWFFEQNYRVGYTSVWWGLMEGPAMVIMALSGWIVYRFRQTRAMTLAQFFEIRYSRKFRIFAGVVAYLSGIINFGIFPSVAARFFIAFCGFPSHFSVGSLDLATYPLLMIALLTVALTFTFVGGQIAVMVTDFLQGVFCNLVFAVLIVFLLFTFSWSQIGETLLAAPPHESMVDPFDLGGETHFDVFYYVIGVVILFYGSLGWQGTQGYYCSAKNAHEAKMANILSGWRVRVLMLIVVILPICVRTFLNHPDFAHEATAVHQALAEIEQSAPNPATAEALRNQMRTPTAMAAILPPGLLGLACAAMLAAFISTHDTYLHSWGTILIQDVVMPFRKKPLTPAQHLRWMRISIVGVAVFIYIFSLVFQHTQYIAMFCAVTASVFIGGAGVAMIGGLYWSRGTTRAAWAAMLTGMSLSAAGIYGTQVDPDYFLTGAEVSFWTIVIAVTVYILISLFGVRSVHDMDRLLHRGAYAVAGETSTTYAQAETWLEKLGFSKEFTGADRVVTYITVGWPLAWTVIFLVGTAYCLISDVPATSWLTYWHGWTWFILACSIAVTIWFAIGGAKDLRYLYSRLKTYADNPQDNGRVTKGDKSEVEQEA
jgi:SSS family solute:Na+ symporter